jgi:hypothetical protein
VAASLALAAAVFFALAATLQQRGQFALARRGSAVEGVGGLVRLLAVPIWLAGTVVLLLGYALQGAALDRGRLIVVQPLLVAKPVLNDLHAPAGTSPSRSRRFWPHSEASV